MIQKAVATLNKITNELLHKDIMMREAFHHIQVHSAKHVRAISGCVPLPAGCVDASHGRSLGWLK